MPLSFCFPWKVNGLEPIAAELSGGQFLPPVQTLAATSIFSQREKMQIESGHLVSFSRAPQQDTGTLCTIIPTLI